MQLSYHPETRQIFIEARKISDEYYYNYIDDVVLLIGIVKANKLLEDHLASQYNITIDYLRGFLQIKEVKPLFEVIAITKGCESIYLKSRLELYLSGLTMLCPVHLILSLLKHEQTQAFEILQSKGFSYQKCLQKQFLISAEYEREYKKRYSKVLDNQFIYTHLPYWLLKPIIKFF